MSATLLLDLDGTLLENDIDAFLKQYLGAFSEFTKNIINPDDFVRSLLAGTQAMVDNRFPDRTLREVFNMHFFPLTGVDPDLFQNVADQFYSQIFPQLKHYTHSITAAQTLVHQAAKRGFGLVVATNPLFPLQAIHERLDWAGLPAAETPFSLITSYETFHFAKPSAYYYAEVMGRIGWPDDPVLMIGNDPELDIKPARQLGLPTFWVKPESGVGSEKEKPAHGSGLIEDFLPWLECTPAEFLQPDYTSVASCLAILYATPAVVDFYARELPAEQWLECPEAGEWGFTEIICHLRDVDVEVNLPRLRTVIETNNPFLPGHDTDQWADQRGYRNQDGKEALRQFIVERMKIIDILEALAPQDWELPARHAIFGPTRLQELVNITASHDRLHLQQMFHLVEKIAPQLYHS